MKYRVIGKDTVYIDNIRASGVWGFKKVKNWRKHYKLVYNFGKVYPYALKARFILNKTDSTLKSRNIKGRDRKAYINTVQDNLFKSYAQKMKNMSISQGKLLIRLIDREVGRSSYSIIKEYKNWFTAGFWQGVAKLFGSDLKKKYDPEGDDKETEELIKIWEAGGYNHLYYQVFGSYPKDES